MIFKAKTEWVKPTEYPDLCLCDEIAIILNGEISIIGDMESLRKEARLHNSDLEEVFLQLTDTEDLSKVISALKDIDL